MRGDTFRERAGELAQNNRGRIPLALVGVLVLVSSMLFIAHVETRGEPNPQTDPSIAIEQTEAATQAALRDGSKRATELAAEQPLTSLADTEWAKALDPASGKDDEEDAGESDGETDGNDADERADTDITWGEDLWEESETDTEEREETLATAFDSNPVVFENYLKAVIYLEMQEHLQDAGQEVGDVETTVALPEITNVSTFEDAIDRIELHEPETGVLDVTIQNVTTTATHDGRQIEERERTMNISITTPILQLHDRVEQYQYYLDRSSVTERGFTQRFTNRIYAIGWLRGWAQNRGMPVVEVMANRHIEPSANSAIYRTQQDVFGAADPDLRSAVRLGWTCMALQDGEALVDEHMGDGWAAYNDIRAAGEEAGIDPAEDTCNSLELFLGDQATGRHPDPPEVDDLLGEAPGMDEKEEFDVGESAYTQIARLANNHSAPAFENAIQRVFTIEAAVDSTVDIRESPEFDNDCRIGSGPTDRSQIRVIPRSASVDPINETAEQYYQFHGTAALWIRETRNCLHEDAPRESDTGTYVIGVESTVSEEQMSPNANITELYGNLSIGHKYTRGAENDLIPGDFRNYNGAGGEVTAELIGGTTARNYTRWLRSEIDGDVTRPSDIRLSYTETVELDHREHLDHALEESMVDDITPRLSNISAIHIEQRRDEMLQTGNESPFARLSDEVESQAHEEHLDPGDSFGSVGEIALYEARYTYFASLLNDIETFNQTHAESVGQIGGELNGMGGIDDAVTFLQQGVSGEEPDPVELESSELTDTITYEVSGSPTYLVPENVTKEDVPAVERETDFAPLAIRNRNYIDLPYEEVIGSIIEELASLIGLSSPDAQISFRMAGDVLAAGDLSVEAANASERFEGLNYEEYDDISEFEGDVRQFEQNVNESIEQYKLHLTAETIGFLYPTEGARGSAVNCILRSQLAPGLVLMDDSPDFCDDILQAQPEFTETVSSATDTVYGSVDETVESYNSTSQQALSIGTGNITEPVIENVTADLNNSRYHYSGFEERYSDDQWTTLVESAVEPAAMRAGTVKVNIGNADQAERIDQGIQEVLGNVSEEIIDERKNELEDRLNEAVEDRVAEGFEDWVGNWNGTQARPARIPAGLPLLPVPSHWYVTVNAWDIEVAGEYARFEVTANMGTPDTTTSTTYVRENQTVTYDIAGEERTLGAVDPIAFEERTLLVVVVRPGVGVGDRDDENPECSPTFPVTGEIDEPIQCQNNPFNGALADAVGEDLSAEQENATASP